MAIGPDNRVGVPVDAATWRAPRPEANGNGVLPNQADIFAKGLAALSTDLRIQAEKRGVKPDTRAKVR